MPDILIDGLSWFFFAIGSALVVIGAIGVWRFPDFYTRIHAAGVTDTMGADLVLLAMIFQSDNLLTMAKLFIIFVFLTLTSPVSTHSIAHAAYVRGMRPKVGDDLHYAEDEEFEARTKRDEA